MLYFYIGDRECGKSGRLLYEASKAPLSTIITTFNGDAARLLVQRAWDEFGIDIYAGSAEAIKGRACKTLLIDEFFFIKDYETVFAALAPMVLAGGDIYIYSSFKDPIKNMKFINSMVNTVVVPLTRNYRMNNYILPHEGVNKQIKVPQIVMDEFIKSIL